MTKIPTLSAALFLTSISALADQSFNDSDFTAAKITACLNQKKTEFSDSYALEKVSSLRWGLVWSDTSEADPVDGGDNFVTVTFTAQLKNRHTGKNASMMCDAQFADRWSELGETADFQGRSAMQRVRISNCAVADDPSEQSAASFGAVYLYW